MKQYKKRPQTFARSHWNLLCECTHEKCLHELKAGIISGRCYECMCPKYKQEDNREVMA